MNERIKKIIVREKIKDPGKLAIFLLLRRVSQVYILKAKGFMMNLKKDSTFTSSKDLFMCSLFPKKVLDIIIKELKPASVLDVGCGTGVSLNYYLTHKIDAWGIENSGIAIAQSAVKQNIIKHNLTKELNLNKKFDLVWCFEVIEHIHPDYETNFLKTLRNHSSCIILSAARPGQGGHGHFNEQEPAYWIQRFDVLGYKYDQSLTERLKATKEMHANNLLCFAKKMDC